MKGSSFFQQQQIVSKSRHPAGQATVEYILILMVAVLVATAFSRNLIRFLDSHTLKIGARLEQQLKTGRTNVSYWSN